jgi:hypothetical protein
MIIQCTPRDLPKELLTPITKAEALVYQGTVYENIKHCKSGEYKEYFIIKEVK